MVRLEGELSSSCKKKKKKKPTGTEAGRCQQGSDGPRGGNRQAGAASGETENGHSAGQKTGTAQAAEALVHSLVPRNKGEAPRARATRLRPLRKVSNRRGRVLAWGPRLWRGFPRDRKRSVVPEGRWPVSPVLNRSLWLLCGDGV